MSEIIPEFVPDAIRSEIPLTSSYHDLYITTEQIPRISIFNLPYSLMVTCTRTGGWELWDVYEGIESAKLLAGEYDENWIVLDVNGLVIVDSRKKNT